jgi:hypothetical protein
LTLNVHSPKIVGDNLPHKHRRSHRFRWPVYLFQGTSQGSQRDFPKDTNGLMYRQLPMIMSLMGQTLRRRWISFIIVLAIFVSLVLCSSFGNVQMIVCGPHFLYAGHCVLMNCSKLDADVTQRSTLLENGAVVLHRYTTATFRVQQSSQVFRTMT